MAAGGSELNPKHPVTGKFQHRPATGRGHVEQSSADHAASIPSVGLPVTYFVSKGRG
jgi:hypothetical protein